MSSVRKHVGVGLACAVAFVALSAPAAAEDDCADGYLVRCQQSSAPRVASPGARRQAGQLPKVQGIPCNGGHLGACIALTQAGGGSFPGLTTGTAPGPGAVNP